MARRERARTGLPPEPSIRASQASDLNHRLPQLASSTRVVENSHMTPSAAASRRPGSDRRRDQQHGAPGEFHGANNQVEPNERNGLHTARRLMVDKITTVPKSKFGACLGRLDDADILRLNQAILVFLGLALSPRTRQRA